MIADHSNKSLHAWIKDYGEPLDVNSASEKELAARVRQLERQLAMREGQIEVLKSYRDRQRSRAERYAMIQPSTHDGLSVEAACEALDVSVSSYNA